MQLDRSCRCWTAQSCGTRSSIRYIKHLQPLRSRLGGCSIVQHTTAARLFSSTLLLPNSRIYPRTSQCTRAVFRSSHDSSEEGDRSQHQQLDILWQQQHVTDQQQQQQRPGLLQHVYTVLGSLVLLVIAAGVSARPSYAAGTRQVGVYGVIALHGR